MTWAWDAPSGVYKNHALSSKIREQAAANFEFARFLSAEPGYGKGKGDTITITRVLQLPLAAAVGESDRLPSGRPAISTKAVTVTEWGFKVETTKFEEDLTYFNLRNRFQRMLRDQISATVDKMSADALKTSPIKYIPTAAATGTWDTDGTPSTSATNNLSIGHLREIRDYLAGTLKAPPMRNGNYIGILSTKAARGIKNDAEYKDWLAPSTAEPFMTGRMRDVENISLFETNHYNALSNGIGTGSVLGEAVFFGDDGAFFAEVESPEIRAGIPEDLGRFREVGWVGTLQAGLPWDVAAQARVVHVSSS